jgi:hypothetical protein
LKLRDSFVKFASGFHSQALAVTLVKSAVTFDQTPEFYKCLHFKAKDSKLHKVAFVSSEAFP